MATADLKITYYEYNAFIIEMGGKTVAVDPGATFAYYFQFKSVIPKQIWPAVSHIVVTHGDPDHYWFADKVAGASGAPVIMNRTMMRETPQGPRVLGPRSKGLRFNWNLKKSELFEPGETRCVDGITFSAEKASHGPLSIQIGPLEKIAAPGPGERVGWGAMGFRMSWNGCTLVNLGDTLLMKEAWSSIVEPDVLMIPIGGGKAHNTMDVEEAAEAVKMMKPKVVIPMHYNLRALFSKDYCPADDQDFRNRVIELGSKCIVLAPGESWQEN